MSKKVLLFFFFCLHKGVMAAEGGGMPQLNPDSFYSQVFWLFISFSILFLTVHYYFLPKISKVRGNRVEMVDNYINEAKRINSEIEVILSKIDEETKSAKLEYDEHMKTEYERNKKIYDSKMNSINSEFEKKKKTLSENLFEQKDKLLNQVPQISITLSDQLYKQILGEDNKGNLDEFNKIIKES